MDYLLIRFLSAFLCGLVLSQTGSFLQLSARNVLASPSTLGFDGLAVLWMLAAHTVLTAVGADFSSSLIFTAGVPLFVLLGLRLSGVIRKQNTSRLILMGLTFNLFVGAVFSLWQFLFMAYNLPFPVELWFGHFRYAELHQLAVLLLLEAGIFWGWLKYGDEIVLLSLGEKTAKSFGARLTLVYRYMFVSIALAVFAVVSFFGVFSFLGLIFPLISRRFFFPKKDIFGELFLGAAVNGLALLMIDALCYYFPIMGAEVPVGLIATSVGAVSLIFLIWSPDSGFEIVAKKKK